jgi:hypothetical protein
MNWAVTIYSAILFFILTPNILVRLPPKSSKFVVAATHAVIFAVIFHFTCKIVWKATSGMFEGMENQQMPQMPQMSQMQQMPQNQQMSQKPKQQ